MKAFNQNRNTVVAENVRLADTFLSRMVGLLNRASLDPHEALLITKCQSIHMLFMRFAIDAIFLNAAGQVVGLVPNIRPFRFSRIYFSATQCLEAPVGTIARSKTMIGDYFSFLKK